VHIPFRAALLLAQALEEEPPFVGHRSRVLLVLRLQLLDVGGVHAVKEGRARESIIQRLA